MSDETLVAGLGSADPGVAAAFVRRFQSRVYGVALTILGDRGAAEEAAQETFVRAWRHAAAYDPRRGRVSTWLLTIARNVAIDMARLRRAEPIDPSEFLAMQLPSTEPGGIEGMVREDERVRLRAALSSLPLEQRRALVLAAFYGRTAAEISRMEDAPLGTIKTRIRSAMLKLHDALEVRDD